MFVKSKICCIYITTSCASIVVPPPSCKGVGDHQGKHQSGFCMDLPGCQVSHRFWAHLMTKSDQMGQQSPIFSFTWGSFWKGFFGEKQRQHFVEAIPALTGFASTRILPQLTWIHPSKSWILWSIYSRLSLEGKPIKPRPFAHSGGQYTASLYSGRSNALSVLAAVKQIYFAKHWGHLITDNSTVTKCMQ